MFEHEEQEIRRNLKREIESLAPEKKIKYNYTEFYQDVIKILRQDDRYKDLPLSEFFIDTEYDTEINRFFISNFYVDTTENNNPEEKMSEDYCKQLNEILQKYDNADFIQQLCSIYKKYGAKDLHFCIIAFDEDCFSKNKLTHLIGVADNRDELRQFFFGYVRRCRNFVSLIRTRYLRDLIEKSRYEATKSAKAAIMSRNMSHNIGSHVMSYLKQKLGSITAIMDKDSNVLYNLTDDEYLKRLMDQRELGNPEVLQSAIQNVKKDKSSEENITTSKKKIEFPFLVGTGRFIGYLQERQDYIATIATDYIPYGAPVNLKDAIYDELNPDLRHMRHSNDDGNRPMNVLLSFIAKSEQLSRENMKIEGQTFSTHNDILFGYPKYEEEGKKPILFGIEPGEGSDSKNAALSVMRKVNFSLPGGLVGRQAIFSIVENLIRNAAKHGKPSNNLELIFDVLDLADLASNLCLADRVCDTRWQDLYKAASDREQLYLFTITDNLTYDKSLAEKLRPALIEDYLDDKGNMKPTNKGIKEIRISAAWMRGEVDESRYFRYDDSADALSGKKAPLVGLEITNEGHLRYMICLPQDRLAAVITDGLSEEGLSLFNKLSQYRSKDWKLYNTIEEAKAKEQSKISYHYMLVAPEKYNQVRPNTSNRLFVWDNPSETKSLLAMAEELVSMNKDKNTSVDEVEKLYTRIKDTIIRTLHHVDDRSEPIYVWDETACTENKDKSICSKVLCAESDENADTAKYVYRRHHGTKKDFETYYSKKTTGGGAYRNIIAVDAITGDNSSDRIVRREPLNEEWYCSHLRALKKRVAIFDERLFMIVHNVDENKFINKDHATAQALKDVVDRLEKGEDFQKIKVELQKNNLLREDTNRTLKFSTDSKKLIEKLNRRIEKCKTLFTAQEAENYKSVFYREKGVDVFTIVREKEGSFAVIGCVDDRVDKKENQEIEVICKYDKVATITFTDDPFDVKIDFQHHEFARHYDYISIHQGILDKIYEAFGIKEHGEVNDPKKCHVTKRLHEEFMREGIYTPIPVVDHEGSAQSGDLDFLPCFIIHSGRAKPTKNDMPQELPFVQYAAIEHGVLDCKYSLVELLDYARYES